jgi:nucleotide-binding universal stress UspA family protein
MKSILALIGGGDRDQAVFETALAAARPFSAHIQFLHIHVGAGEAARFSHAQFAMGPALREALEQLASNAQHYSDLAEYNVRELCARHKIQISERPSESQGVTASFREERNDALERLTFHARRSDLIVMGRARQTQGLPPYALEHLILSCGRPMLVAGSAAPQQLTGTIMVCWKGSDHDARAVAAATPILNKAKRIVFASATERRGRAGEGMHELARQFAGNGISTEVQVIPAKGRGISASLSAAAETHGADLVVMGAYGHSRLHELLFGSCTEAFMRHADRPILLMH